MPIDVDVVWAASGKEAIRATRAEDFALVLLDVQMPEMDGFETAALIRAHEATKDLPVIFVTALDDSSDDDERTEDEETDEDEDEDKDEDEDEDEEDSGGSDSDKAGDSERGGDTAEEFVFEADPLARTPSR